VIQYHIHQIYYSGKTRRELDAGFIPLNNLANERPDWREYWPIRNFLLENKLVENDFYGFLSPKFREKTHLGAGQVRDFIGACDEGVDVVIFSPFRDQQSFFPNIFAQGESNHPGFYNIAQDALNAIGETVDLDSLLMDSRNCIFSNFFVARPRFWKTWLALNEKLFMLAEGGGSSNLVQSLNSGASHNNEKVPYKVFLMERIASYIPASQPQWKSRAYNPYLMPGSPSLLSKKFPEECLICDALKIAYSTLGYAQYREVLFNVQRKVLDGLKSREQG